MPTYTWVDLLTDTEIIVRRSMDELDVKPDKDECLEQGMEVEDFADAEWERRLSPVPNVGPKNKGNW